MFARIEKIEGKKLVGIWNSMSIADNKTAALWQAFMPRCRELKNRSNTNLISMQVYDAATDFARYNPQALFQNWAAAEVENFDAVPPGMETYQLPAGTYAVFIHKGLPSDFGKTAAYIFGSWLPQSGYEVDARPHFAVMGPGYKPDDPNAEEEVWMPVKEKKINLQPHHLHNHLVQLKPLSQNDFEALYAVAVDPLIWEQHPQQDRYQWPVFQACFDAALQSGGPFAVRHAQTAELVGSSPYYDYNAEARTVAIGYTFLARAYWGGAYNGALKQLMLDHAFTFAEEVVFHIGPHNIRSQKALQKLVPVPLQPQAIVRNGAETLEFRIAKRDWQKAKALRTEQAAPSA